MLLSLFLLLLIVLLTTVFRVELELTVDGALVQPVIRLAIGAISFTLPKKLLIKARELIRRRDVVKPGRLMKSMRLGLRLMDSFVQRVEIFRLQVVLGTGDPFWSALSCGGLWSILGPFFSGLSAGGALPLPEVSIHPSFEEAPEALPALYIPLPTWSDYDQRTETSGLCLAGENIGLKERNHERQTPH